MQQGTDQGPRADHLSAGCEEGLWQVQLRKDLFSGVPDSSHKLVETHIEGVVEKTGGWGVTG